MDTKQLPVQHISLLVMHRCQLSHGFSEPLLSGVAMPCGLLITIAAAPLAVNHSAAAGARSPQTADDRR